MRMSHFLSKALLSVLFLPTFLSAELIDLDHETEMNHVLTQNELEASAGSFSSHSEKKHNESVFASYRNSQNQTIAGGGNVLFNVKNANKGGGIRYNEDGTFTIKQSGFYLINYGLASIGNAGEVGAAFGFDLVKISKGKKTIVDSALTDSSSAIVLHLKENDKIAIVSQKFRVHLIAGSLPPRTTSLTDTAHISFLRLER